MLLGHCQQLVRRLTPSLQRRLFSTNRLALCTAHRQYSTEITKKTADDALTSSKEYLDNVERFKDIANPDENWVSHGFNPYDREDDDYHYHVFMFCMITVVMTWGAFILAYLPDNKMIHWRQREAYLELARREAKGLPLVDPNLVPAEKMLQYLPTDEELGDTDIII